MADFNKISERFRQYSRGRIIERNDDKFTWWDLRIVKNAVFAGQGLTANEKKQIYKKMTAAFWRADKDHDGSLSAAERNHAITQAIKEFKKNS